MKPATNALTYYPAVPNASRYLKKKMLCMVCMVYFMYFGLPVL